MRRIAIIVQRCGEEVVGGSEGYAFQMGKILSDIFNIDILTTTAKDYETWSNYYKEGIEEISNALKIFRFKVDFEREIYWHELNRILFKNLFLDRFSNLDQTDKNKFLMMLEHSPIGLQEEWIKFQGPYSSALFKYINENKNNYDLFILMTYLYPTTYFGIDKVENKEKIFIIPTFHDEPPAYLNIFGKYSTYKFLFLSMAEKRLASRIFKSDLLSEVIGLGMEDKFNKIDDNNKDGRYILYAGRLDSAKGVEVLCNYFERFSKKYPDIKLYTIGDGPLKHYKHKSIEYLGFLSEEEKLSLMRGALAFVHPSAYESLGIVLLEAFMMGTPVLVNSRSEVLNDHIVNSDGGYSYSSYEEFEKYLSELIENKPLRNKLGKNARQYYLNNYFISLYKKRLVSIFEDAFEEATKD